MHNKEVLEQNLAAWLTEKRLFLCASTTNQPAKQHQGKPHNVWNKVMRPRFYFMITTIINTMFEEDTTRHMTEKTPSLL